MCEKHNMVNICATNLGGGMEEVVVWCKYCGAIAVNRQLKEGRLISKGFHGVPAYYSDSDVPCDVISKEDREEIMS